MTKLKIPSKFLRIAGGPYKGYDAELVERSGDGREFLVVNIGAISSSQATIPIGNIIFVMEDGRLLRYVIVHGKGLSLMEVGKEESGKIIKVSESVDSPSKGLPTFFPDLDLNDTEIESINTGEHDENHVYGEHPEIDYGDEDENIESNEDETKGSSFVENYDETFRICRDNVILDNDKATQYLADLFQILGFHMDNTSINHHSKILHDALKSYELQGLNFSTEMLKSFVIAYIFIHVNNMGIGYPISIPGVKMKSNDDPSFITKAAFKRNFVNSVLDVDGQINVLARIFQTNIVPSSGVLSSISNRFALLRVSSNTKKSIPIISNVGNNLKMLKFPLYEDTYKKQSEIKAKNVILNKLDKTIKTTTDKNSKDMLKNLRDNFDVYIKGSGFKNLNNNPDLAESKIMFPFIKEYKERLGIEEEKFYRNSNKTILKNGEAVRNIEDKNLKKKIMSKFNEKITNNISNNNTDEDKVLKYVIEKSVKISKMTTIDLKELKTSLNTASDFEQKKINAVIEYRNILSKIMQDSKKRTSEKNLANKRENYKIEQVAKKFENLNTQSRKKTKVYIQM
jgi:hypothetical protein